MKKWYVEPLTGQASGQIFGYIVKRQWFDWSTKIVNVEHVRRGNGLIDLFPDLTTANLKCEELNNEKE